VNKTKKICNLILFSAFFFCVLFQIFLGEDYGVKDILKFIGIDGQVGSQKLISEANKGTLPREYQGKLKLFVLAGQSNK
jgi:hypothetical protein